MTKPWSREEFASLLDCLRRHSRAQDAINEHNRQWKSNRTVDSARHRIERQGLGGFSNYLRVSGQRRDDLPEDDQVKLLVDVLKKQPSFTAAEVCNRLDVSPARLGRLVKLARDLGKNVEMPTDDTIALTVKAPPIDRLTVRPIPILPVRGHLRWAVASDLHFASLLHRRACLTDFLHFAHGEFGIREVFCPGDIVAGMRMYHGQQNEVLSLSDTIQINEVVNGLPQLPKLTYRMIGGNHDESFHKNDGTDVVKEIAKRRPDVIPYGFYSALFDLVAPGCKKPTKIELHHPDKAGAYAISYHMQKEIEQIPPGMKPQLIFMGHTHVTNWLPDYRGVAGFYCGTFEDQTLYLKRKHVAPSIGGWIIDAGIAADGGLRTLTATWVKYYHQARGQFVESDEHGNQVRLERSLSPID